MAYSFRMRRAFLVLLISSLALFMFTYYFTNVEIVFLSFRRPGLYPDLYPCHYTNLRPRYFVHERKKYTSCQRRVINTSSCHYANKYFGSPQEPLPVRTCPEPPKKEICTFEKAKALTLVCNPENCGTNEILMGDRDQRYGHIQQWTKISPFTTNKAVRFVKTALTKGETFCFIRCGSLIQALVFPPHLYMKKIKTSSRNISKSSSVNINIILLDSMSRTHFYRMLRQSVHALRNIMQDTRATVLDFELFQSISTHTFENVRAMFSGVVEDRKDNSGASKASSEIGHRVLYKHFKSRGYQTIFQEDLCWYDRWGTVLDNIRMKGSSKPSSERWNIFKKIVSNHQVDNFGLTFFSCEVLKLYNETNHFENPDKVCLNGRFFSSYFLRYLEDLTSAVRMSHDASPYVSYTHFNTGHTHSGTRIRNMDQALAHFIGTVGRDPWTWTILLADHGHKVTEYALYTEDGQYEATNPLLFMIVPQNVAQEFGKTSMKALEQSQTRLITALDLHHTLMTFHDVNKTGLLEGNGKADRMCRDVPLMPLAKCQCYEKEAKYEDNSPKYLWMAEFAVGQLNNEIQKQFYKGAYSGRNSNCKRLIGSSFRNIIQTGSQTTFDLHLNASHVGITQDEVIKVAVETSDIKGARLQSFERITMYNKFKGCADKSVDIKLCVCDRRPGNSTQTLIQRMKTRIFNSNRVKIENLYKNCLFKVTRSYSDITFAIELFNNCSRQTFHVEVKGYTEQVFISSSLPYTVVLKSMVTRFLYSATTQATNNYMNVKLKVIPK